MHIDFFCLFVYILINVCSTLWFIFFYFGFYLIILCFYIFASLLLCSCFYISPSEHCIYILPILNYILVFTSKYLKFLWRWVLCLILNLVGMLFTPSVFGDFPAIFPLLIPTLSYCSLSSYSVYFLFINVHLWFILSCVIQLAECTMWASEESISFCCYIQ